MAKKVETNSVVAAKIIRDINNLLRACVNYEFHWGFREENEVADKFANFAAQIQRMA